MKKLGVLVFSGLLLLSLSACKNGFTNKNNNQKGSVSLKIQEDKTSRTITPFNDTWSIQDVEEWNIRFENKAADGNSFVEKVNINSFPREFVYPEGEYTVTASATVQRLANGDYKSFIISGSVDVTVDYEEPCEEVIYVSFQQSENATGTFNYGLSLSKTALTGLDSKLNETRTEVTVGDYTFRAYLTSCADSSVKKILSISDVSTSYYLYIKWSNADIPSGYYYLTIEYTKAGKNYVLDVVRDPLVEIFEGLTTSDSSESEFTENVTFNKEKIIYVANTENSESGLIPQSCMDFNAALTMLKNSSNDENVWKTAKLYFVTQIPAGTNNVYELYKGIAPLVDVSKNPTKADDGRTVDVYVGNEKVLYFMNGETYLVSSENELIYYSDEPDTEASITLDLVENPWKKLRFFLYNTKLTVNNADSLAENGIYIDGYNVVTDGELVLTINTSRDIDKSKLESMEISYADCVTGTPDNNSYLVYRNVTTSDDAYNVKFFTIRKGSGNINLSYGLPGFYIENDETNKSVYHLEEGETAGFHVAWGDLDQKFEIGTKITWYYNNHQIGEPIFIEDEEDQNREISILIDVYNNPYTIDGYNHVNIIAEFDGEKASSDNYYTNFLVERIPEGIIYFGKNSGAEEKPGWQSDIVSADGSYICAPYKNECLYAYCFDENFNLYVLVGATESSDTFECYKYAYSKAKIGHKTDRTLIGSIDKAETYIFPARITANASKSELVILTKTNNKAFNNTLYKLNLNNTNPDIPFEWESIAVPVQTETGTDDFDYITAIGYDSVSKHYFIAGEIKQEIDPATLEIHFKNRSGENDDPDYYYNYTYAVKEYNYDSTSNRMIQVSGGYSYSYDDYSIIEDEDYAVLSTPATSSLQISENQYVLYKTLLHCPVTDIGFMNGDMVLLRVFTSYNQGIRATNDEGSISWEYKDYDDGQYCFSVVYKPRNGVQTIINMPDEGSFGRIYPVRILAIKKDDVIFGDGKSSSGGYTTTEMLNLHSAAFSIQKETDSGGMFYGYDFDQISDGSNGSYKWNYHDTKVIQIGSID